ncbi:phosphatase PAP2 family protein [Microbacterium sp. A84]|uniref:phosphatase PAP2 family protein n=1 Tax=Microbacterium sp. A84 TaxID=3450715 RepID=UPI003F434510
MTRRALLWWGIGAILAAMALGASLTAAGPDLPSALDVGWNDLMVSIRSPLLIDLADVMNHLGGGWVATLLIPLVIIAALLIARRWKAAVFVAVTLLASVAAIQLLKQLYGRARPEDMLVTSDFGSFPSGHTANAATLAMLAALLFPRLWVVLIAIFWTLAMAFSRTALSVHWLTDTIGGMLVGAGAALVVGGLMLEWVRQPRNRQESL